MSVAGILETVMLVCFGAAWPASIAKSWRSRSTQGKSLFFLLILLAGYAAGIAKTVVSDGFGGYLLIPYCLNVVLVSADAALYFRNALIERAARDASAEK
ncbi:MAG: hypothetical protein LBS75_01480 [Synergistaceae bacterium]|jgi:hypothetical protein|nr:hypothetical protein [Synergistaceae bacterium]